MAQLKELAGSGPVNEGERVVVARLVSELPKAYVVIPNFEIADPSGQRLDYDIVVLAPHAVYVIETKAWLGAIVGDDREWNVSGTTRAAPIRITSHKARVLKGRLTNELPVLSEVWVEPAVVLAFPPKSLILSRQAKQRTFYPADLVKFLRDPSRLPHGAHPVDHLVERASRVLQSNASVRHGPKSFQQWEVIETLASDGLTTEYSARHKLAPNSPPARLKAVSLSPYTFSPDELDRIRRSVARDFAAIRTMGQHPNIAAAIDVFEDEQANIVVVADELEGLSLALALVEGLDIGNDDRLEILLGLANAVAHAHHHGVIHRRITPENVILVPDGTARLVGFGNARVTHEGTVYQSDVPHDVDVRYLAPEVLDASIGEIDAAADLFSLAAVGWALGRRTPADLGLSYQSCIARSEGLEPPTF